MIKANSVYHEPEFFIRGLTWLLPVENKSRFFKTVLRRNFLNPVTQDNLLCVNISTMNLTEVMPAL